MVTTNKYEIKKSKFSNKNMINLANRKQVIDKKPVLDKKIIQNPDVSVVVKNRKTELVNSDLFSLADYHKDHFEGELFNKVSQFRAFITDVRNKGYYQYQRKISSMSGHSVIVNNKINKHKMILFASNNYLGLTGHPEVIDAAVLAIKKYGSGSGGVPLLGGTMSLHKELERRLARFKGMEDAVLFSSGYSANVGIISSLVGKNDVVVNDKLNHASIIDGSIMSGGQFVVFPHNNMRLLEKKLASIPSNRGILLVVDGVFSMDGDIANLPEIINLKKKYNFRTMIDEAHATGVIGSFGRGTPSYFNLEGKVDIVMGTMSKALGAVGGFIASSEEVVDYVRHYARSFFFSTSLPPATIASLIKVIDILERDGTALVKKLHNNSEYFRYLLSCNHIKTRGESFIPIVPIIVGDDLLLRKIHSELNEKGLFVNAVPYPAVPKKECRLRLSIMATHTRDELEYAANEIVKIFRKYNLINV